MDNKHILLYLGAGLDFTFCALSFYISDFTIYYRDIFMKYANFHFKNKNKSKSKILSLLSNIKQIKMIDGMPKNNYFPQYCESDDYFIDCIKYNLKNLNMYPINVNKDNKLITALDNKIQYYYSVTIPEELNNEQTEDVDILCFHGMSIKAENLKRILNKIPTIKTILIQSNTSVKKLDLVRSLCPNIEILYYDFCLEDLPYYIYNENKK